MMRMTKKKLDKERTNYKEIDKLYPKAVSRSSNVSCVKQSDLNAISTTTFFQSLYLTALRPLINQFKHIG